MAARHCWHASFAIKHLSDIRVPLTCLTSLANRPCISLCWLGGELACMLPELVILVRVPRKRLLTVDISVENMQQFWDQLLGGTNPLHKCLYHCLLYTGKLGYPWLQLTLGSVAIDWIAISSKLSLEAANLSSLVNILQGTEQWNPPLIHVHCLGRKNEENLLNSRFVFRDWLVILWKKFGKKAQLQLDF